MAAEQRQVLRTTARHGSLIVSSGVAVFSTTPPGKRAARAVRNDGDFQMRRFVAITTFDPSH